MDEVLLALADLVCVPLRSSITNEVGGVSLAAALLPNLIVLTCLQDPAAADKLLKQWFYTQLSRLVRTERIVSCGMYASVG